MNQVVIVCYKPRAGQEKQLLELVKEHVPILLKENLATDMKPVIMQAKDGTIIEVFEWCSAEAIEKAHKNPAVLAMWGRFAEACEYVAPNTLPEFQHIFSTFDAVDE